MTGSDPTADTRTELLRGLDPIPVPIPRDYAESQVAWSGYRRGVRRSTGGFLDKRDVRRAAAHERPGEGSRRMHQRRCGRRRDRPSGGSPCAQAARARRLGRSTGSARGRCRAGPWTDRYRRPASRGHSEQRRESGPAANLDHETTRGLREFGELFQWRVRSPGYARLLLVVPLGETLIVRLRHK